MIFMEFICSAVKPIPKGYSGVIHSAYVGDKVYFVGLTSDDILTLTKNGTEYERWIFNSRIEISQEECIFRNSYNLEFINEDKKKAIIIGFIGRFRGA